MKKLFIQFSTLCLFIFLTINFSSCHRKINVAQLYPKGSLDKKFPFYIEPRVRIESLEGSYSLGTTTTSGGGGFIVGNSVIMGPTTSESYADPRVKDALLIAERDITRNIGQSTGIKKMEAVFTVAECIEKKPFNPIGTAGIIATTGLYAASTPNNTDNNLNSTTTTPNSSGILFNTIIGYISSRLWGIPLRNYKTTLLVELELKDLNGNTLGKYEETGIGKAPIGLWWSYSKAGAQEQSNIIALKDAMNKIKKKIDYDYSKILATVEYNNSQK